MRLPDTAALAIVLLGAALLSAWPLAASAQQGSGAGGVPSIAKPETTGLPAVQPAPGGPPSIQSSLGRFGDPGGLRQFLGAKGIAYNFIYIGEVLGNPTGGVRRGAIYEGLLQGQLDADFETIAGLTGVTGHVSGLQIHGRGLTGNNLRDLFIVSSIEAFPSLDLFELYLEKKLLGEKLSVRAGQLAASSEFFISQTGTLFVNSTFGGWAASLNNNLPSGGPSAPLATPGIRVKATPTDQLTLFAAVFNGDPAGAYVPGFNNIIAQLRDTGGTDFRVQDPPLVIGEAQYAYNQGKDAGALPGVVKLGAMHHFEQFAALNAPAALGRTYRGNTGIYGIIDQTIYREPGTDSQGASAYLRATYFPPDRNLFDLYFEGGVAYKGLLPKRPDDTFGFAFAYARVSPDASRQDILSGAAPLIRDFQAVAELTYQATIVTGFTLQPDFQYVFHPGAHGVADPRDGQPTRDAVVLGLRTTIVY